MQTLGCSRPLKLSRRCFKDYLSYIHRVTGITIDITKKQMVIGRIHKRVAVLGLDSYQAYLHLLKVDKGEERCFVDLITTNETYFYRTPRIWSYIRDDFLPSYYARHGDKPLNIWSAAAATGEEAYTLGILCHTLKREHPRFNYRITGTDISAAVINRAMNAVYRERAIKLFRRQEPHLFDQYFSANDRDEYQVLAQARSQIRFQTHNLFSRLSGNQQFDLILLRNALIYFNREDQEKVLANIHHHLTAQGCLIVGESESLIHLNTDFESVMPLIYRAKQ